MQNLTPGSFQNPGRVEPTPDGDGLELLMGRAEPVPGAVFPASRGAIVPSPSTTPPPSPYRFTRGRASPLGATSTLEGVNFVLTCRHGTSVTLVLQPVEGSSFLAEYVLDPRVNRTGDQWHVLVSGLPGVFRYGFRVAGPVGAAHRFNPEFVLLDPTCTAVSDGAVWGQNGNHNDGITRGTHRRSLFVRRSYEWRGDEHPRTPLEDSVVYELHVRGFTIHSSGAVSKPGTFAGLIEKIPHLQQLGVTAVELLPIDEFDEDDCPFMNPQTKKRLRNFWGYNSIAFASPKAAFAASGQQHNQVNEFRDMVRAFHEAGIEIILDVVFNHTGEGDDRGRTYSFRGLDNELYYMLGASGTYMNFSGCGNTVNCNHPVVREMIVNCLRFWVGDMHVDGLRFDLASVLGRDRKGHVLLEPPIIEMISEDPLLRDVKLIAEPWDAVGLYQVGNFPYGGRWSEWNGQYRDDVRKFWRGEPGMSGALATRLAGSADLYQSEGRSPSHSINFITCHDGFTLWDLVSYNHKHNEANGEGNRDGMNENHSWNCGIEGPTRDTEVIRLRKRQAKNLMATLLLSQGVPMILGGDEFLRTQKGNNNAWCQDNEISWVDWSLADTNADFLRFTTMMFTLRKRHPALRRRTFYEGKAASLDRSDIVWHGTEPNKPDFSCGSRILAYTMDGSLTGREPDRDFYIACNSWRDGIPFQIPRSPSGRRWRRVVDTALLPPHDIVALDTGPLVPSESRYFVEAHSLIVFITEE